MAVVAEEDSIALQTPQETESKALQRPATISRYCCSLITPL